VIHTDFQKCFISADQYNFDDFKALGSEAAVSWHVIDCVGGFCAETGWAWWSDLRHWGRVSLTGALVKREWVRRAVLWVPPQFNFTLTLLIVQVKKAGKCRTQGKTYVVQDGDIMFFKHNAGGSGKKK
jgi:hypothetical protein